MEDREKFEILGSSMFSSSPVEQKLNKLQKLSKVVTKLDAHYGFYLLENCFSLPKLQQIIRTSPCFGKFDLLQQYDSHNRKSLSKICIVNFIESSYTQTTLPGSKGDVGNASAPQNALPASKLQQQASNVLCRDSSRKTMLTLLC